MAAVLLIVAGAVTAVVGVALLSIPVAVIVAGGLLLAAGIDLADRPGRSGASG